MLIQLELPEESIEEPSEPVLPESFDGLGGVFPVEGGGSVGLRFCGGGFAGISLFPPF